MTKIKIKNFVLIVVDDVEYKFENIMRHIF